jgi:uridine phosphorylase
LRLKSTDDQFLEVLNDLGVTNFEMETSAIYGLSKLLGHKAITINNVIAIEDEVNLQLIIINQKK